MSSPLVSRNRLEFPGSRSVWKQHVFWVALGSSSLLLLAEVTYWIFGSDRLYAGIYFQPNSSDEMMATIEIQQLVDSPIKAFLYLHTQPPGFDFLRLLLAMPEVILNETVSPRSVDLRLLILQIFLFGLLNSVVLFWSLVISASRVIAYAVTLGWALYPGNLFTATMLDSMYLSTFFLVMTLHFYFLALRESSPKWLTVSAAFFIALAFTRANVQPVVIPILVAAALFVLYRSHFAETRRQLLLGALAVCATSMLLPAKQVILFGTPSSSTVSGHHLLGMIRHLPTDAELSSIEIPRKIVENGSVFQNKFNNLAELELNYKYSRIFFHELSSRPIETISQAFVTAQRSLVKGAGATHAYQRNVMIEDLPWSTASAGVFSGLSYAVLLVTGFLALVLSLRSRCRGIWRRVMLQFVPPAMLISILSATIVFGSLRYSDIASMGDAFGWTDGFTWTESNRYKFLLESVMLPAAFLGVGLALQCGFRRGNLATIRTRGSYM
jgi:hypothetical protein